MKLFNNNFAKFTLLIISSFLILDNIYTVKASLKKSPFTPEYSKIQTPNVIVEMIKIIKKYKPEDKHIFKLCLNQITLPKYEPEMKSFWDVIKEISCKPLEIIKIDLFLNFITKTSEKITVDAIEKDCKSVMQTNLLTPDDVQLPNKQKELRDQFSVYFTCISPPSPGKLFISAFLGPHRGSSPNSPYKALNGH